MEAEIFTMGLDVGSTTSKCLVLKNGGTVAAEIIVQAGTGTTGPARALSGALEKAGLQRVELACLTATGYGRNSVEGADHIVSELSCHAIGAFSLCPGTRTVVDIGGQDAKVLRLDAQGRLENFVMNDKCAAGTGRFLEVMAKVLELTADQLAEKDARAKGIVPVSSTCTVFAESEVISQLARNVDICDLVAGIHASVAVRTASLVRRLGLLPPVTMTGGVARNAGVVRAMERELGVPITVPDRAQLAGAYGAALYGWRKLQQKGEHV